MSTDHEARLRQMEVWSKGHEMECAGRHRALNLRFDQNDAMVKSARSEAEAARAAAEVAVAAATKAAAEGKIGRAAILGWLKALALSIGAATAALLTASPWAHALWKFAKEFG